jgi:hypothetical protein
MRARQQHDTTKTTYIVLQLGLVNLNQNEPPSRLRIDTGSDYQAVATCIGVETSSAFNFGLARDRIIELRIIESRLH